MPVRPVLRYPAPVLKQRAAELIPGPEAEALTADLVETMRASPSCVGLAAPQIGVPARAFCVDVGGHPKTTRSHGLIVMLDPVVEAQEGSEVVREGCMSLPDFTGNVRRARTIRVRGTTPSGGSMIVETEGFEARALQHEIDHLDGVLFLDRISSIADDLFRRKRYA